MSLKAVVEKLDDVEEGFRSLYTEKNGKFEITGIEGMRTQADIDRIQSGLVKEREDHKKTRERYARFHDLDLDMVLDRYDRFEELEAAAAGKLDPKKMDELVDSRIKSRLGPVERERDQLKSAIGERDAKLAEYARRETQRAISDKVREAAVGAKILPEAMEDALLLAERVFEVTEDGRVVTKDNVGVIPGIEPSVWFTDLHSKRPHWWGPSQGGGASGGRGGAGSQKNPWTNADWNLTEQGAILRADPVKADQLAKAAGTSVGGLRPSK